MREMIQKKLHQLQQWWANLPRIGEGHAAAMGRLGLSELRAAFYPQSNIAQPTQYGVYRSRTPGEIADAREEAAKQLRRDGDQEKKRPVATVHGPAQAASRPPAATVHGPAQPPAPPAPQAAQPQGKSDYDQMLAARARQAAPEAAQPEPEV